MSKKRKHAYGGLKDVLPESSIVIMAKAEFGSEELEEVIVEMAEDPVLADITQKQLSTADIQAIEKATIGQPGIENWKLYRKGKITASNFHRVYTRVYTLKTKRRGCYKAGGNIAGLECAIKKCHCSKIWQKYGAHSKANICQHV